MATKNQLSSNRCGISNPKMKITKPSVLNKNESEILKASFSVICDNTYSRIVVAAITPQFIHILNVGYIDKMKPNKILATSRINPVIRVVFFNSFIIVYILGGGGGVCVLNSWANSCKVPIFSQPDIPCFQQRV